MLNDGDLWMDLYQRICAKGHHAVAASWVKGHATMQHVEEGKTTLENKLGNDAADTAANEPQRADNPTFVNLFIIIVLPC